MSASLLRRVDTGGGKRTTRVPDFWNTMLVLPDLGEKLWVTLTLKEMIVIKKKSKLSNLLYVLVLSPLHPFCEVHSISII